MASIQRRRRTRGRATAGDSALDRLRRNDPTACVTPLNCRQVAAALKENTHVRRLQVKFDCYGDSGDDDTDVSQWETFCQVAQTLPSLERVDFDFEGWEAGYFESVYLLLRRTQDIKEIMVQSLGESLGSEFAQYFVSGIIYHHCLEKISLSNFHRMPYETHTLLMSTFSRIQTLKSLSLTAHSDSSDSALAEMTGDFLLGRLLSLPVLEELTLSRFDLGDGGRQQAPPTSLNPTLRKLEVSDCTITMGCFGAIIHGAADSSSLQDLDLVRNSFFDRGDTADLLAPLSRNASLKKLYISFQEEHEERPRVDWPRFDFLLENASLDEMSILEPVRRLTGESFASLCRSLETNISLAKLDLNCRYITDHRDHHALVQMIHANKGLKRILLSGIAFSGAVLLELASALAQNKTLQHLDVNPGEEEGRVDSADTANFVRGALKESRLRTLRVGRCCVEDMESLVPFMAQNYNLEELKFGPKNKALPIKELQLMLKLNVIGSLNAKGRRYMVGERGPACKAAGVKLLSAVSDNLDCLFYHLGENPGLCSRSSIDESASGTISVTSSSPTE